MKFIQNFNNYIFIIKSNLSLFFALVLVFSSLFYIIVNNNKFLILFLILFFIVKLNYLYLYHNNINNKILKDIENISIIDFFKLNLIKNIKMFIITVFYFIFYISFTFMLSFFVYSINPNIGKIFLFVNILIISYVYMYYHYSLSVLKKDFEIKEYIKLLLKSIFVFKSINLIVNKKNYFDLFFWSFSSLLILFIINLGFLSIQTNINIILNFIIYILLAIFNLIFIYIDLIYYKK